MATLNTPDLYTSTILILILAFLYQYVLYSALISPLSRIPKAHWSCSISPVWILWNRFNHRENRTLHAAHKRFGPVVRIGPNELSVNSADGVKTIYQGGFDKHQWYSLFNNYGVSCMFSSLESKQHSQRKRMVSHVYSKSYLHASPALAAQADVIINERLMPQLEASASMNSAGHPHAIDVHSFFCATAMDFISSYTFGLPRSADFLRRSSYRAHWLVLYATREGNGFFAQELPKLSRVLSLIGIDLIPSWVTAANHELEAWCKEHSDAAIRFLENEETKGSVLDTAGDPVVIRALLAGLDKEATTSHEPIPPPQRDLIIASEIIDHVLAGQETTGVALTYLTYHLSRSLPLQETLRRELLTLSPNLKLNNGRINTYSDPKHLDSLPVLNAVITETIRRYTPAGGPEPRVTPTQSCRIGPYKVPGGVRVSASPYNIHRDEVVFPDPETWDHTRWLRGRHDGNDNKEERERDVYRNFWGFSSGGRMCLGSNFAMHEMKLVIAAIYSNYTSHIINDEGVEQTDAYTGRPKSNSLYLRFERIMED
ncbi:cytochrome P450 [Hypoxylon trugodes]|uniref:cytochrome P450 n=1 Tax=Hypoxylon trugodes TaxID=326681 RepID=UPI00219EAD6A|nr:cytochrome P450 [Hypoxylon trugodes]KAI1387761.1 cytochrome P450 [Hypoxylon trugodes]